MKTEIFIYNFEITGFNLVKYDHQILNSSPSPVEFDPQLGVLFKTPRIERQLKICYFRLNVFCYLLFFSRDSLAIKLNVFQSKDES